jgi:hypothetical protein
VPDSADRDVGQVSRLSAAEIDGASMGR